MTKNLIIAVFCIVTLIYYVTYDSPNQPRIQGCYGECYEEYIKVHGTVTEILVAQAEAAADDPFSSIRGLWGGCAACHGSEGQGMGAFPALAGRDAEYIIEALTVYRDRGTRGNQSTLMWGQASVLSETDIDTLGRFVEETMQ